MLDLGALQYRSGARHPKKRVARGTSSGHGKTAGRGHKGQKSRSGGLKRPGFEGGQTPLYRRLPKHRGFNNDMFKTSYVILNLSDLVTGELPEKIDPELFIQKGWMKEGEKVKILGDGDLSKALHVSAHAFSQSAKKKIEGAGGSVEVITVARGSA